MSEVSLEAWNDYIRDHPESHFLQTGEWGELKRRYGWDAVRLVVGNSGAQMLFRRLPMGLQLAYIPKIEPHQLDHADSEAFWSEVDGVCRARRAIACKLEVDSWDSPEFAQALEGFLAFSA